MKTKHFTLEPTLTKSQQDAVMTLYRALESGEKPPSKHKVHAAWKSLDDSRSEEHTSELQSPCNLVCRLLLEKKKNNTITLSELLTDAIAAEGDDVDRYMP